LHHAVADGWSMGVLLRELEALYGAALAGRPSPLPELPVQYADFAVWQRRWLRGEALSRQLDYWRHQLAGAPAGLHLPTDFPRPAVQTFNGAIRSAELPLADLRELCRREGVTLFMALLAGLDVLLSRYSGQEDVLVGSPVANRNRIETEGLIGFFVNTLVLRLRLGEAVSFRDLLLQARETTLAAYGFQDLPFETLVEELKPQRDLSRSPFFQVLLSLLTFGEPPGMGGLRLSPIEGEHRSAKFDLSVFVVESESAPRLLVEHNTGLYEGATIQRLLGHLRLLLLAAAAAPERRWRDLPLLSEEEREQLLSGFNDTGSTPGLEVCLHQLFEAAAARVPDQVALIAPGGRLTYRELDARAGRLARRLRSLGLGPERLAGVLLDRTADLIVTLLAIQKAGGAYVPLDPGYPRQRVRLMLETARAGLLVTRRPLAVDLPEGTRTVFLDPGWESEPVAEAVALPAVLPENLAYVIFTSGSTGVPKGVAVEHRSAVSMVRWCLSMYSPEEYAGVLVSTSVCFDMSVFEIFATLAAGGRLILAENALALPALEARDEVVLIDTVPSAMAELLRSGRLPSTIRTVNLGGEPLKASLVQEIHRTLPGVERVVNLYGPSEDTTFTSYAVVPRDTGHPLIGRPLTGEQAYVLDGEMRPVPVGVPGALSMGGEGVTRGYLHRPDLTAERYVPNPYGAPGSRLYTVGDLVRYLPAGELDYLGRLDHQVKVRGFRIELGEIEAALAWHGLVREAAVLATPDPLSGNRLVAYVETGGDLSETALRAHLKESLPGYMIPSSFVLLRELPRTPNGKLDRRALAALPLATDGMAPRSGRAPRGPVEEALVEIWQDVLGRPVGVEDSFFDLGGHSLLATRLVAHIQKTFGAGLELRHLFEEPTVEQLAARILQAGPVQPGGSVPPVERAPSRGELPLTHAQRRLWFLAQLEPGSAAYNVPLALELAGPLDAAALRASQRAIEERHEILRTVFQERAGQPFQRIGEPGAGLPVVDLSALPRERAARVASELAAAEGRRPFDLAAGPPWRSRLLRVDDELSWLVLSLHHILCDGWSIEVLLGELGAGYAALTAGGPPPPPPAVQYGDYALWQQLHLGREALAGPMESWKRRLAGHLTVLDLAVDRPPEGTRSGAAGATDLRLPARLLEAARELGRREGATLFMTLLAAYEVLLWRYTGLGELLVGTPVANRPRPELQGVIGLFANVLALPATVAPEASFRALLAEVREVTIAALRHQDLPLEMLVQDLAPERGLSHRSLLQATFTYHGAPIAPPSLPGLATRLIEIDAGEAKLDLSLAGLEMPGGGLRLVLEHQAELLSPAAARRLLGHFATLLEAALADPGGRVDALPLLTAAERAQHLVEWNDTVRVATETTLHAAFERQAALHPGLPAVCFAGEVLTYRELDREADRLARLLRARGVGPEVPVALCFERSVAVVVAMLGVLKAGGAYLPLDLRYPAERLAAMLEDAGRPLLVSERRLAGELAGAAGEVLWLDDLPVAAEEEELPEAGGADSASLAYVLYTSGSTGRP
ncbi:MAG TPA: amino acid adenylation domain-containing protein, partial [Thermoanaerobaculia bacterium]|nr:amino acid adenylation domain-containing protein [Thermoanaerobaculia bacterium]